MRILFAVFITVAWLLPAGMPLYAFLPAPAALSAAPPSGTHFAKRKKNPPEYCRAEEEQRLPSPEREPVYLTAAGEAILPETPFSTLPAAALPLLPREPAALPRLPCGARAGPAAEPPFPLSPTA